MTTIGLVQDKVGSIDEKCITTPNLAGQKFPGLIDTDPDPSPPKNPLIYIDA